MKFRKVRDEERDTTFVVRRHDCFDNSLARVGSARNPRARALTNTSTIVRRATKARIPTHQAPRTAVLKQMTPEHVLDVLTNGSMRSNAAALSDADKRLIAEWVGGRKIDNESVGAAEKMTNVCSTHPPVRESNAPAWNGWGADLRNTRSQTAAAAGLTPAQVSRLQLKWAFGFPGATALYSQTIYDGRLYVSSNAGYVYSLDADSGCVHWAFRAQAAVRSSFTIGRLSRTNARLRSSSEIFAAPHMRSMHRQAL